MMAREPGLQPVGGARTPDHGLAKARSRRPDVAIVDQRLRKGDGLSLTRRLKALPEPPAVLVYSAHVDGGLVVAAVVAGADGVVSKGTEVEELCRAIQLLA